MQNRQDKRNKRSGVLAVFLAAATLSIILVHLIYPAMAQAITYPFADDIEDPVSTFWVGDAPWGRIDSASHSPTHCWTDSPSANYSNDSDLSLALATSIDLTTGINPQLKFWCKYLLEEGYDYLQVEISTDNGATWETTPLAEYTGNQSAWTREQIDLASYSACTQVKVRFRLITDSSIVTNGFYLDDIAIDDKPQAVVLNLPSNITTSSMELSWSKNEEPAFAFYKLYRSLDGAEVNEHSQLIATISDPNTVTFEDTGLAQKTTYNYCIYVVSNAEIYLARS